MSAPLNWKNVGIESKYLADTGQAAAHEAFREQLTGLGDDMGDRAGAQAFQRYMNNNMPRGEALAMAAKQGGADKFTDLARVTAATDLVGLQGQRVAEETEQDKVRTAFLPAQLQTDLRAGNANADIAEQDARFNPQERQLGIQGLGLDNQEQAYGINRTAQTDAAGDEAAAAEKMQAQRSSELDAYLKQYPQEQRRQAAMELMQTGKITGIDFHGTDAFKQDQEIETERLGRKPTAREEDDRIADSFNLQSDPMARKVYMENHGDLVYKDNSWQPAYRAPARIKNEQELLKLIMADKDLSSKMGLDSHRSTLMGMTMGETGNAFTKKFNDLDEGLQNTLRTSAKLAGLFGTGKEALGSLRGAIETMGGRAGKDWGELNNLMGDQYQNMLQAQQGPSGLTINK